MYPLGICKDLHLDGVSFVLVLSSSSFIRMLFEYCCFIEFIYLLRCYYSRVSIKDVCVSPPKNSSIISAFSVRSLGSSQINSKLPDRWEITAKSLQNVPNRKLRIGTIEFALLEKKGRRVPILPFYCDRFLIIIFIIEKFEFRRRKRSFSGVISQIRNADLN